jgi:hypothetical protein
VWDRAVKRTTRTYDFRKSQVKANHGQFPAFTDAIAVIVEANAGAVNVEI